MKKHRVVFIHDPNLRKIRNNLRRIICHAVRERIIVLRALRDGLDSKLMTDSERVEKGLIYTEILELQKSLKKSICMCGTCQKIENDMIYIPSLRAWHCVKCDSKKLIWYPSH